ncbi:MAG: DUF4190 domain-containing protein [Verrucomicrobiota bacterium]|nr:DUF4190 domain-containing protein [Verrucomicrobiota bacterium]
MTSFSVRRISLLFSVAVFVGVTTLAPSGLLINIYELLWVTVLAGIYLIIRRRQCLQSVSFLAIISLTTAILNPAVTHIIFKLIGLPWVGRGDSELRSFAFGVLAVVTGHVALVRIRRANPPVRGRAAAWIGLVIGYLWVVSWISVLFLFAWGMSHFR